LQKYRIFALEGFKNAKYNKWLDEMAPEAIEEVEIQ